MLLMDEKGRSVAVIAALDTGLASIARVIVVGVVESLDHQRTNQVRVAAGNTDIFEQLVLALNADPVLDVVLAGSEQGRSAFLTLALI
jgi:hypothetical protein